MSRRYPDERESVTKPSNSRKVDSSKTYRKLEEKEETPRKRKNTPTIPDAPKKLKKKDDDDVTDDEEIESVDASSTQLIAENKRLKETIRSKN